MVLIFLYNTYIHIFFYHLVLSSYHICNPIIYHECIYALLYSYIHIYLYIFISLYIIYTSYPLCVFYHDLAIHVLSIFLSCMLLLIHLGMSIIYSYHIILYSYHVIYLYILYLVNLYLHVLYQTIISYDIYLYISILVRFTCTLSDYPISRRSTEQRLFL